MTDKVGEDRRGRKLVKRNSDNVRVRGEFGSLQNKLRYELYRETFKRIDRGLREGNHWEVISLCDSLIIDRVNSFIQFLRRDEDNDYPFQSVGETIQILFTEAKDQKFTLDKELKKLLVEVNQSWLPKRNFSVHSFVVITHKTKDWDVDHRLNIIKECSEEGSVLCRKITNRSNKILRTLWRSETDAQLTEK